MPSFIRTLFDLLRGRSPEEVNAIYKAAEQGDVDAQCNLGWMYRRGLGVQQDNQQAISWLRKAAEQGFATAQFKLGLMYSGGLGVPQDDRQAYAWFSVAAANGHGDAQEYRDRVAYGFTPADFEQAQALSTRYVMQYHPN